MIIKKSEMPVLAKGKGTGRPYVTVTDKGQISFSPLAAKTFDNLTLAVIQWDEPKRTFSVQTFAKPPKGWVEADMYALGCGKKSKTMYFSAASILQSEKAGIGYDYKGSGSQQFDVTMDTEKHIVSFVLPKGALTPRVITPRQKKKNKVEAPKTASAAAGTVVLEEE